jgi:integrase
MASLIRLAGGKNPPLVVKFTDPNDKQREQRIHLGKVGIESGQTIRRWIEKLVVYRGLNQTISPETAEWLAGLSATIHDRLAKQGLCEYRTTPKHKLAPTLAEWLERHIAQRRVELKPSSIARLTGTKMRLLEYFGIAIRLDALDVDAAKSWRSWLCNQLTYGDQKLSEATVRLHCRNAKTIFADAAERELMPSNPFAKLRSTSIAAERNRYVTPAETLLILEQCPTLQIKLLFALARWAGLRCPSETHRLRWGDVDSDKGLLTVFAPKTGKTRIVPIRPELAQLLQEGFLAAPPGTETILTIPRSNLHRTLERVIVAAGIVPWDDLLQTLRRSCETEWAETCPQHAVSSWIGHSIAVSLKHYTMTTNETLDKIRKPAMTKMDSSLKTCWTYFIQSLDGGLIKIGYTEQEPETRLMNLQTGSPQKLQIIGLTVGNRERELHSIFKHLWSHGEWFHPANELLDYIREEAILAQ